MERIRLTHFGIFFTVLVLFSSCRKYDEGGPVRKADENLKGEWDLEKAFKNGDPITTITANPQVGEVTEDWWFLKNTEAATEDGNATLKGQWELTDKDKSIKITINKPASKASEYTYEIIRLEEKIMIWEHMIGSDRYRYEFKLSSKETPSSTDEL